MGLFGSSSPFDTDIEKATNENNTTDQWGLILEICDRVGGSSVNAKECLRSVMRRLAHTDPHVVIQAITLLDACVSNCGKTFHLEVASREFENEFRRLIQKQQILVALKMVGLIKKWAEGEFKSDPSLNLIPSLYAKLKSEGIEFPEADNKAATQVKQPPALSKDPNVVSTQQEMDDIAKAIELSLKESPMKHAASSSSNSNHSKVSAAATTSLYPTTSLSATNFSTMSGGATSSAASEARKVRALYDFEAAEDNELNFIAGDIIHVTDDSDPNWWKGYNQRGEGLFPASFVSADLSVEPESLRLDLNNKSNKKFVQFADDVKEEDHVVEINEEKLDRLLHLLHEANPEDPSTDTAEMLNLENMVNQMGPLIDTELERVDRTHEQLARLSVGLVDAFNLYHTLMREAEKPQFMGYGQVMYGGHPNMPPMMMNQGNAMYSPQHHPPQPGMPYMQGAPHNGPYPVSSGPTAMPMMGPNASQAGPMPGMAPHQQQQQQQQHHPQAMQGMHPHMNNHPSNMMLGTPQQQQPQMHHEQTPPQMQQNGASNNHHHHHHHQQQPPQQQMNPNTVTSSSMGGGPITNPGQPPSFCQAPPPQTQPAGPQGAMNYPQGPPMPQSGGGGVPPGPQMFGHPVQGPGVQFQPQMANGASPQHMQQGSPMPAPHPGQGNMHPGPMGGAGVPQQSPMPAMGNYGNNSPMAMGGGGGGPPPNVTSMMHPGAHQSMPAMGGDMNNIPIYQQQR